MKRLDDIISNLKKLQDEVVRVIADVVREYDYIVIDMNATDQLRDKGINRDGIAISDFAPYAPLTIQIKKMKGQPTTRVTLKDEGDFHASFYIEYLSDGFLIKASDWKTEILIKKYGHGILGLTDENAREFAEDYIKPAVSELLIKIIKA